MAALMLAACGEKIIDERPVKPGDDGDGEWITTKYQNPVIRNNAPAPVSLRRQGEDRIFLRIFHPERNQRYRRRGISSGISLH